MAPDLLLLAGASAWRLGAIVLLAVCAAAVLVALRVVRGRQDPARPATMGLWGHVAELRDRLLWCVGAWLLATLAAFSFRVESRPWGLLPMPALHDNLAAQTYRALADRLVPDGVQLVVLRPLDGFSAEFTIAMALGFVVALPVLLLQGAAFLAPALKAPERRMARVAVLPALALFITGATVSTVFLTPTLLDTLYGYSEALGAQSFLLVSELVSFVLIIAVIFGFASLTPLVMAALSAIGLVGWRGFLGKWRHAVVASVVLCALVTDGTIVTVLLVAAPLVALYFVGIALSAWTGRRRATAD